MYRFPYNIGIFNEERQSKKWGKGLLLLFFVLTAVILPDLLGLQTLSAAPGDITTFAGGGVGDSGSAPSASLYLPRGIYVTGTGEIYIADTLNHRIRKIDANGIITTVAGKGTADFSGDGGLAVSGSLKYPLAVAVDHAGNIFIADAHNHRVRRVSTSGTITTIIGGGTESPSNYCSLTATDIGNIFPQDVFLDSSDRVHIAAEGQLWRLETGGMLINLSDPSCGYGSLSTGFSNGFFDASGAFIYASGNDIFRTADMRNSTLLGTLADVSSGSYAALSGDGLGNIYIASLQSNIVYKLDSTGASTVFAGTGAAGYSGDGGYAVSASINNPTDVFADQSGNVYIADRMNHRIRKVDFNGTITTVAGTGETGYAGDGLLATLERLNMPRCVFADSSGNVFIADTYNHRVRKIDTTGTITTIAGNGVPDFSGDGGPATAASLFYPTGIFVHSSGTIYIADSFNDRIRKIDPAGTITTIAGTDDTGYAGDGGPAELAVLNYPTGVLVDDSGNVFIADLGNNAIRKIDTSGIISTYVNVWSPRAIAFDSSGVLYVATTYDGINRVYTDGSVDLMPSCSDSVGVAVDSAGAVYMACQSEHVIKKVAPGMSPETIAGTGSQGFSGDGGAGTAAMLSEPSSLFVDYAGTIYIADSGNDRIRRIASGLEPSVIIQSPVAGITNNATQLLLYSASSGTVIVKVDGAVVNKASGDYLDPLGEGSHTIRVEAANEYGTDYDEKFFSVDTVAPAVLITSPSSGTVNENQPLLTYTVSEGTVTVFVDWMMVNKVSGDRLDLLYDGTHTVRVESTDAAGNTGFAEVQFTTPPAVFIESPISGYYYSDNTPFLMYWMSAGSSIVKVDGIVVDKISGEHLDALADGQHTVRVEATNENGTGFAEGTFTVDTITPTVIITSPATGTTAENKPLLTYTASEGSVTVRVDGVIVNKVSGDHLDELPDGTHFIRVESADAAGNVGFAEVEFTVTTPPVVMIDSPVAGSTITNNSALLLYSVSNGTVVVKVDGIAVNKVSAEYLDPLEDGLHTVRVEATNAAGTGFAESTFTVDATAPTVAITSPTTGTTEDNQPLLAYSVSDGTVTVKVDGIVVNRASGSRLYALPNGLHTIRVESTDSAKNTGFAEVTFTVNAPIERITENFETGDLSKMPWTTSGNGLWTVTSTIKHGGAYAAEAPMSIGNSQSASLEVTRTTDSDTISFWYSVSSEKTYDYLKFYIDGVQKGQWSGSVSWAQASYAVSAGTHTFKWVYSKDASVSSGSDTAWIDDIVFPLPPPAPTVTITSPGSMSNSSTPALTYTVSGGTVVVRVDGVVASKVSGEMLDPLADGAHVVRVEANDANGTGYAEKAFTVDTIAPTVTITSPTSGTATINNPVLNYTVSEGTVAVTVDGAAVNKASGTTLDPLADGAHTVRVESTDAAGNIGSAEVSFIVDTKAIVNISSPAASPTNNPTPLLIYTADDGVVVVKVDGVVVSRLSGDMLDVLADGSHVVRVESTDSVGNFGFAEVTFVVDTVSPAVSLNAVTTPTKENIQNITGTRESGALITVTLDTTATVDTASYPTDTTWACTISGLVEGVNTVTVIAADAAGNTASAATSITYDSTAPTVVLSSPATTITHNNKPVLAYTVSDGAVVAKVDGNVVQKISGETLDQLADGSHTIRVEAADQAGNTGFAEVTFVVDTVAPTITINPVTTPTNVNTQTIQGSRESGAVITISYDTSATVGSVIYPTDTSWSSSVNNMAEGTNNITITAKDAAQNSASITASITFDSIAPAVTINSPGSGVTNNKTPLLQFTITDGISLITVDGATVSKTSGQNLDSLSDGTHTVRVEATDIAGNIGFAEVTFTVDTITPAVAINAVSTPTNASSQMVTGSREENAAVSIAANTSALVGAMTYPSATTWSCTVSGLVAGSNTVTVTATDAAGNSASAAVDITFDAIVPTVSISAPGSSLTNDNTPLLTYAVSDGSVLVKVDGVAVSKVSGDSLDVLSDGNHTVFVEATDAAGNIGSAEVSFVVDTVAPAISINPVTTPTKNTYQTITGTRESGASVSVSVNTSATVGVVSYGSATTWSCTISNLVRGNNIITARALDGAGNSNTATATVYRK